MKPRAAGEADESFLVQSDEVRWLQSHSASDDAIEIMNMTAATPASIILWQHPQMFYLQVGEHFDGIERGSSHYSPNAYLCKLYPEDL